MEQEKEKIVKKYLHLDYEDVPEFIVVEYIGSYDDKLPLMRTFIQQKHLIGDSIVKGKLDGIEVAVFSGPFSYQQEGLLYALCVSKAKAVYAMGIAGSLQKDIKRGDIIIPSASIRGDGLTKYYAPPEFPSVPAPLVTCSLLKSADELDIKTKQGIIYTTESMFKELDYIKIWQHLNIIGIDQNLSKHFLLAHIHGKMAGGILAVSDSPVEGDYMWIDGVPKDKIYYESIEACEKIIARSIQDLSLLI